MDRERFEKMVEEGIEMIPQRFLGKLDNVEICIEDEPTPYQLKKIKLPPHHTIFGLYEGVPLTKRWYYNQALPDKITIFQKTIERWAQTEEDIKELVKKTVWHEIAHHFGMDEHDVRTAEKKRAQKKV